MDRLRSSLLALMGGALLVTLSISAAFGVAPSETADATRGQAMAVSVHELVFDDALEQEDEDLGENESDEKAQTDELAADSHGKCVSEVARDKEASATSGEDHGTSVSEAARVTCVERAEKDLTDPEEDEAEANEDVPDDDSHGACVSEVARDKSAVSGESNNHGGAVSKAAHQCGAEDVVEDEAADVDEADAEATAAKERRAEKAAEHAAAQSEKEAAKADRKAANRGNATANNGGGNGKGHGKP